MSTTKPGPYVHVQHNPFYDVFSGTPTSMKQHLYAYPSASASRSIDSHSFEDLLASGFESEIKEIRAMKKNLQLRWPTPLQSVVWSNMLKHDDTIRGCVIQGKRGTGKTICAVLPIISRCRDIWDTSKCALYVVENLAAMDKVSGVLKRALPDIRLLQLPRQHMQNSLPQVILGTPEHIYEWVQSNAQYHLEIRLVVYSDLSSILDLGTEAISASKSILGLLGACCRIQVMLMTDIMNEDVRLFANSVGQGIEWFFVDKEQYNMSRIDLAYERVASDAKKYQEAWKVIVCGTKQQCVIVMDKNHMLMFQALDAHCDGICMPDAGVDRPSNSRSLRDFKTGNAQVLITSRPHLLDWRFLKSEVKLVIFIDIPMDDVPLSPYNLFSSWMGLATVKVLVFVCGERDVKTLKDIESTIGYNFRDDTDNLISFASRNNPQRFPNFWQGNNSLP